MELEFHGFLCGVRSFIVAFHRKGRRAVESASNSFGNRLVKKNDGALRSTIT